MIENGPTIKIHMTLSGDVFLKSRRTQKRLIGRVRANLTTALASAGYEDRIARVGTHRFEIEVRESDAVRVRSAALTVFGLSSVDTVVGLEPGDMDSIASQAADLMRDTVSGRTFAARVRRRGTHDWNSIDLARQIGSELHEVSAGVDLSDPDVEVSVMVFDEQAFLVTDHQSAAGGLPLGTQDRVLCLVSGGGVSTHVPLILRGF